MAIRNPLLTLISAEESPGGLAVATFRMQDDGLDFQFTQHFAANATRKEIVQTIVDRCLAILEKEAPPAVESIKKMFGERSIVLKDLCRLAPGPRRDHERSDNHAADDHRVSGASG